jgi:ketosteroid isomerase-like protein
MKRTMQIIMALMFIVGGAFSAFAQSNNGKIVEQILKLETEYTEATKKLSGEDSERFYAPDFMVTARIPPRLVTRAERLARLKDPNFRRGTIESLTNSDVKVRVYGDSTAIVTAAWKRVSQHADGKDGSASGRLTHVWVKQNGKWLLAAAHYSPDIDLEKLKAAAAQNEARKN